MDISSNDRSAMMPNYSFPDLVPEKLRVQDFGMKMEKNILILVAVSQLPLFKVSLSSCLMKSGRTIKKLYM